MNTHEQINELLYNYFRILSLSLLTSGMHRQPVIQASAVEKVIRMGYLCARGLYLNTNKMI